MSNDYLTKNRGFITSSKIKEFLRCQKCYRYKYIDEIPDPTESGEFYDKDHFLIGQALDDRLTHGEKEYKKMYETVSKRSKDAKKIQLTNAHSRTVDALTKEFLASSLFCHEPKKHIIETEYAGLKLRAELDDIELEKQVIRDVKSCANIAKFNPDFYLLQMSFYQWLVEETEGIKCDAMLEVVDKYKYFSRSKAVLYSKYSLESYRGRILQALEDIKLAHESGIYANAESQIILYSCPYYGYLGHGRPTEPMYY